MRTDWKIVSVVFLTAVLSLQCVDSKKATKTKLLKKLRHNGHMKAHAAHQRSLTGEKKNAVQPTNDQVAAMQNPESLQPSETEELNQLQNYNKQYINNEMAAETALLADQGIDDDSALKISNMAALPNGMPPGANAAIKAKISGSSAHTPQDQSAGQPQNLNTGYDPNAYLYDANSWPEYTIHDSDYSHFRSVEMNNMNGENTDMPPQYNKPDGHPDFQNMANDEKIEFQGQKFQQEKGEDSESLNDEMKQEDGEEFQKKPSSEGSPATHKVSSEGDVNDAKPAVNSGATEGSKSESSPKPQVTPSQQKPQVVVHKAEDDAAPAKDAPSQKQLQQQQQQQQQQTQKQPQVKTSPAKIAASVAEAAASLPPKAIASLVSSLVGGGKIVTSGQVQEQSQAKGQGQGQSKGQGQGQGQGQARSAAQSLIPQDINPAQEQTTIATQLHVVAKPKRRL